ncbi:MAG: hypothetical protein ACLT1C_07445 [Weissella confusa]
MADAVVHFNARHSTRPRPLLKASLDDMDLASSRLAVATAQTRAEDLDGLD